MRFPFRFFKSGPNDFLVKFVAGRRSAEGKGLIVFVGPRTTLARFPATDVPVPFIFTELTKDGQPFSVQGEVQVRLTVDALIARRDYTIDPVTGEYRTDDPESVNAEAGHALQSYVRRAIEGLDLKAALAATSRLEATILEAITKDAEPFTRLGVTVAALFITSVAPANPDLKKALEAEAREQLFAAADKALADRRRNAAESDRALKEYEAETARTLEEQRAALVKERNANTIAEAEADATAAEKRLAPYRDADPRMLFALGIRELGASNRIGQVNFTPDFLAAMQRPVDAGNGRG